MRLMSFALTAEQIRAGSKDITRRVGWACATPGLQVRPVLKSMGRRAGEPLVDLRPPITIVSARREMLRRLTDDLVYGVEEVRREGFPHLTPAQFVEFFCDTHRGVDSRTLLNRIEFRYA